MHPVEQDESIIRCICSYSHDDGFMIGCDECSIWQHVACSDLDPSDLHDLYYCEVCLPRTINPERAIQIQRRFDTSDSEVNRGILSLGPNIATFREEIQDVSLRAQKDPRHTYAKWILELEELHTGSNIDRTG